jgi:thiol-disulfide isomerase/thioredoxin
MKRLLRFSLALAILAGSLEATLAADGWIVDFKEAQKRAAAEGKDILMEFTGSDWCPPCIQLKKTCSTRMCSRRRPLSNSSC